MKQKINRIRRRSGIVGILFLLMMLMFFWIGYPEKSILTAYERTLSQIRKDGGAWIILIADMNCLKVINDEHGHNKGDEAISKLASCLKKYFGSIGECFRIGGDEFCVLAQDISVECFDKICQDFRAALEEADQMLAYPFSASMGYVVLDESGIDECVKKADRKMYEEKRMKGRVRL